MALIVYTNTYSTIAQNNLTKANNSLSKSIERLSSGLRINHASDDASGLAVSEKLRGQIRGMAKASLNAQDAASYLQTAEGGMEVITDMLQRMRELAVQAGNGVYTTGDRAELQKEVDQLKSEIDRISSSTEFNTKKVLTGNAAALWSANTNDITAVVRGVPAEGNYKLDFAVEGGQNAIYKTDVMGMNKDMVRLLNATGSTFASSELYRGDGNILVGGTFNAGVAAVTSAVGTAQAYYAQGSTTASATVGTVTISGAISESGYLLTEIVGNTLMTAGGSFTVKFTFIGADGQQTSVTSNGVVASGGATATINGTKFVYTTTAGTAAGATLGSGTKSMQTIQDGIAATNGSISMTIPTLTGGTTASPSFAAKRGAAETNVATVLQFDAATGNYKTATVSFVNGTNGITAASTANIEFLAKGSPAASDIQLKDIARFTNQDGRMILDNTQELTLYGNGGSKVIYMEGSDTIDDFINKLNNAMNELGMEGKARYNQTGGTLNDSMPGAIVFESGNLIGSQSDIRFTGDEALINALSIGQLQKSEGAKLTTTVTDAHTGLLIGKDTVTDYMVRGIIQGIDVKVSSVVEDGDEAFLHVVDNRSTAQIGANEGQTFDISIAQMDTVALEIDDAFVTTFDEAQKAITKFDQALTKVTSARATIGAQINRLEYTMNNLAISSQNLIAAESRIRDLDVAAESATFARNQVLVNAAVAMVAQANTLPQTALQLIGR